MPDNVVVVAAGNLETDKGVTFRTSSPNHLTLPELAVDFDDWQDWAVKAGIRRDVVGYLNFAKSDLLILIQVVMLLHHPSLDFCK